MENILASTQSSEKSPTKLAPSLGQLGNQECSETNLIDSAIDYLAAEWFSARKVRMQIHESRLPNQEEMKEERRMIKTLVNQFKEITVPEFRQAIHIAADKQLERNRDFPTLTHTDIRVELQAIVTIRREKVRALALPVPDPTRIEFETKWAGTAMEAVIRNLEGLSATAVMIGGLPDFDTLKHGANAAVRALVVANDIGKAVTEFANDCYKSAFAKRFSWQYHAILDTPQQRPTDWHERLVEAKRKMGDFDNMDGAPDFAYMARAVAIIRLNELRICKNIIIPQEQEAK